MAKIGNEATLILKLAKERMEKKVELEERTTKDINPDFLRGLRFGFSEYRDTLTEISLELERK